MTTMATISATYAHDDLIGDMACEVTLNGWVLTILPRETLPIFAAMNWNDFLCSLALTDEAHLADLLAEYPPINP
jgi:hypothetical protein